MKLLNTTLSVGAVLMAAWTGLAMAQLELPGTDLWLLEFHQGEMRQNSRPLRLTLNASYDNQPVFSGDSHFIFYTQGDALGYTDIFAVSVLGGEPRRITNTPTSEFSPRHRPGTREYQIGMIQVRDNGEQWLVNYDLNQRESTRLNTAEPVGYHAWMDEAHSALFILGEPNRLEIWPVDGAKGKTIAENIGRALEVDQEGLLYFVQLENSGSEGGEDTAWLHCYNPENAQTSRLIALPAGSQDFTLAPDGSIWSSAGSTLFQWRPEQDKQWQAKIDLGGHGLKGLSRLAIAPNGRYLAIIAEE